MQTSCGFGVPLLSATPVPDAGDEMEGVVPELKDRETLGHWASKMVEKNELRNYQKGNNAHSLDGLPGLRIALKDSGHSMFMVHATTLTTRLKLHKEALCIGISMGASLVLLLQWLMNLTRG